jgi:hypothetical protein
MIELSPELPTVFVLFIGCKRLKFGYDGKKNICVDQTQNVDALYNVLQVKYQCQEKIKEQARKRQGSKGKILTACRWPIKTMGFFVQHLCHSANL